MRLPERKLTVCIAANANHGEYLVCAADTMVASGIATTDPMATKIHLFNGWAIMLSGTLGQVDALVDSLEREITNEADNEPKTIRNLLEKVHKEEIGSWSAGRWLSPFGLDMPTFLSSGKSLPESVQSDLSRNIAQGADGYDAEIMVCGWGSNAEKLARQGTSKLYPCIFSVDYRGIQLHKTAGLYACGSGSAAAMSTLYFHDCGPGNSLSAVIYSVAAAKFMAEKTLGVGPNTAMIVLKRTGGFIGIPSDQVRLIRQEWEEHGAPRKPHSAIHLINKLLENKVKGEGK